MRYGTGLEMEDFRVKSEEELDDKNGEARPVVLHHDLEPDLPPDQPLAVHHQETEAVLVELLCLHHPREHDPHNTPDILLWVPPKPPQDPRHELLADQENHEMEDLLHHLHFQLLAPL